MLLQVRKKPPPIGDDLRAMLDRVAEPAILIAMNHEILAANAAYREKYGDVGRSCYAASREFDSPCDQNGEPCPLRATMESGRRQRVFHIHHGATGPRYVDVEVEPILDDRGRVAYFLERILEVDETREYDGELVGRATTFLRALGLLQRAAPSEVPVLLLGESGTGKELAARAVHRMSHRRHRPFMPVECSGLPENLFESELFGYEQGAFTGANKAKRGLVGATAGGTLFLDEIGDVPLPVQVKLLRLLESGTYRRVGGTESHRADFRLVCATHRDLAAMVEAGTFRQDLYYRINAFPVILPPLRERSSDIGALCDTFLAKKHPGKRLTGDALVRLAQHDWPGNVRELRNVVDRMALLADGDELGAEHLPLELTNDSRLSGRPDISKDGIASVRALEDAALADAFPQSGARRGGPGDGIFSVGELLPLAQLEAEYLRWAADRAQDRASLAQALGISERTLYRKLDDARRHG